MADKKVPTPIITDPEVQTAYEHHKTKTPAPTESATVAAQCAQYAHVLQTEGIQCTAQHNRVTVRIGPAGLSINGEPKEAVTRKGVKAVTDILAAESASDLSYVCCKLAQALADAPHVAAKTEDGDDE